MTTSIRWRFLVSLLVVTGVLVLGVLVIGELIASFRAESRSPDESGVQGVQAVEQAKMPPAEARSEEAHSKPVTQRSKKPEETLTPEKQIEQVLGERMRQADKAVQTLKEIEKIKQETAWIEAQRQKIQAETKALKVENERALQADIEWIRKLNKMNKMKPKNDPPSKESKP